MSIKFKDPDLNAPRFRPKRINVLNRDLFNAFLEKNPEYSGMSLAKFKEIIRTFNGEMVNGIQSQRDGVELPEGLGFVFIGTCPKASTQNGNKNIDYKKSRELGVLVTHQNWDSNNKLMKVFYTNLHTRLRLANRQLWAFRLAKQHRQSLSKHYKVNWNKFRIVPNAKKISNLFVKFQRSKGFSEVSKDYDEFNLD